MQAAALLILVGQVVQAAAVRDPLAHQMQGTDQEAHNLLAVLQEVTVAVEQVKV